MTVAANTQAGDLLWSETDPEHQPIEHTLE